MVKSSDRDQGVTPLSKSLAPLARLERAAHGLGIRKKQFFNPLIFHLVSPNLLKIKD